MNPNKIEDIMRQVDVRNGDECWLWQGGLQQGSGYGKARMSGESTRLAHVIVYKLHMGPIPEGKLVLHTCNNKACCNPGHLYLGDYSQNARDAIKAGKWSNPISSSGLRGVFPYRNGWRAAVTYRGVWTLLYQGKDFFEACCARKSWEARQALMP